MPRARKGSVCEFRDERGRIRYKVGITLLDGTRRWQRMPPGTTEARARATADSWNEKSAVDPTLAPPCAPTGETVADYAKRWLDDREARGIASIKTDRQRARDYIVKVLGPLPVAEVTKVEVRQLVQLLDDKVRAEDLAWKTAHHIWTLTRTMFRDACSSKRGELVAREDDPTDKVEGPDRGDELARAYLYPSEFRELIECPKVPVAWRRLYALAAYTLSRAGELSALRWDAVDLQRGVIHFRQAADRFTPGRVKSTKTGKARRVPIEPSLRPLLEAMFIEATDEFVVHVPVSKRAEALREHLDVAGITRTELFAPPKDGSVAPTWAPLTFHDLRGTGVTWMALRGDEPLVIQQRAGHANFATTQRYLREAETLGKDAGEPFPPLPPALLESIRESLRKPLTTRNRGAGHGVRTWTEPEGRSESSRIVESERRDGSTTPKRNSATDGDAERLRSESDPVEAALAKALEAATAERRWDVVAQLGRELEARRLARTSNVVRLPAARRPGRS